MSRDGGFYLLDSIEVTEATMIDVRLSSVLQNDIVETPHSASYDPYPGRWKREGILAICSDDINPTKVRREWPAIVDERQVP